MEKRIEDWKDLRYGMFIHWGLYSLLERGEWVMWSEAIDKDEYRKLCIALRPRHSIRMPGHRWPRMRA